jgi:hypothetical protein
VVEPAAANKGAVTRDIKGIAAVQGSPTIINMLPPDIALLMGQRPRAPSSDPQHLRADFG